MAEFCNNCLIDIEVIGRRDWTPEQKAADPLWSFIEKLITDPEARRQFKGADTAGLVTAEDVKNGKYGVVLCERCDFTLVDENGNCLSDCDYRHGTVVITGRPGRSA